MPDAVLDVLICPVCGGGMKHDGAVLRCALGHSFDIARQGYVNLQAGHRPTGTADTAAMIAARTAFLDAGHYAPIADAVTEQASGRPPPTDPAVLLDAGAGTGYYLARVLDALPGAYGIAADVSAPALRRAARAHPRAAAIGADVWRGLPVRDGAVSVLMDVFAPRNVAEFARVLHPEGALVVVIPTANHLAELTGRFGILTVDERKDARTEQTLGERFVLDIREDVTFTLRLAADEIGRLIRMGPSAHHVDDTALDEALRRLPSSLDVTASVTVSRYSRRAGSGASLAFP